MKQKGVLRSSSLSKQKYNLKLFTSNEENKYSCLDFARFMTKLAEYFKKIQKAFRVASN